MPKTYRYRRNPMVRDPDDELEQPKFQKLVAYTKSCLVKCQAQFLDYDIARERNRTMIRKKRADEKRASLKLALEKPRNQGVYP